MNSYFLNLHFQSLLMFILPFEWRYPFVPVLSRKLLELIDAPGPFMMGCHSYYRNQVESVSVYSVTPKPGKEGFRKHDQHFMTKFEISSIKNEDFLQLKILHVFNRKKSLIFKVETLYFKPYC